MGLGGYPGVGLADARDLIRQGIDPIQHRRAERAALNAPSVPTFEQAAEDYIRAKRGEWRNSKHASQWSNTLRDYAFPVIGNLPVNEIELDHILRILRPLWQSKTETASRLRGRIESVLSAAKTLGYRTGENPALWRGNLENLLSKPEKTKKAGHHATLPYAEVPVFMAEGRRLGSISARALEFTVLTAARTGEVLNATWDEFSLESSLWTVPAERMKAGREHRAPLSDAALEVLRPLHEYRESDSAFFFPGARVGRPLSQMALLMCLRGLRPEVTVHGFRSTFRDWIAEATTVHPDIAEAALAHVVSSKARAAYERGDELERRRELMQMWADHCASTKRGKVVPIRGRA